MSCGPYLLHAVLAEAEADRRTHGAGSALARVAAITVHHVPVGARVHAVCNTTTGVELE